MNYDVDVIRMRERIGSRTCGIGTGKGIRRFQHIAHFSALPKLTSVNQYVSFIVNTKVLTEKYVLIAVMACAESNAVTRVVTKVPL